MRLHKDPSHAIASSKHVIIITCFEGNCKLKIRKNRYFTRFRSIPRYNSTGNAGYKDELASDAYDNNGITVNPPSNSILSFEECSLYLDDQKIESITVIDGSISLKDNIGPLEPIYPLYDLKLNGEANIYLSNFEHATAVGAGTISVYNTAKEKSFKALGTSEFTGDLQARSSGDKMEIQGRATKAEVNGYGVFPSFSDWLNDNVYIIPLMLLTVIGGAITLTLSCVKGIEEKKKTPQETPDFSEQENMDEAVNIVGNTRDNSKEGTTEESVADDSEENDVVVEGKKQEAKD